MPPLKTDSFEDFSDLGGCENKRFFVSFVLFTAVDWRTHDVRTREHNIFT